MNESLVERIRFPAAPWILCAHALRQMSKGLGWHLAHGSLVIAYFVAVLFTEYSQSRLSAAGLDLFQRVTYLNLVFITMVGIGCFSVCVVSERESGTLELLRLSGTGFLGFLVGRWLPLLVGCAIMLVLQIPCTSFAVTLGGVLPGQIQCMAIVTLVHLFLVASVALWISIESKSSQQAVLLSFALFGAWFSGPQVLTTLLEFVSPNSKTAALESLVNTLQSFSAFGTARRLFESRVASPDLWSSEQTWQVVIGLIALIASRLGYERSAAVVKRASTRLPIFQWRRRFATGFMAIFWKDFYFISGGWKWIAIRIVVYPTVSFIYGMTNSRFSGMEIWLVIHETTLRIVGWETAIVSSQIFQREFRDQTWELLTLLPHSSATIRYSKLAGSLAALAPGWIWTLIASWYVLTLPIWGVTWLYLIYLIWIVIVGCHVAVLVSVLFPHTTWSVAMLMGVVTAHVQLNLTMSTFFSFGNSALVIASLMMGSIVISIILHIMIHARISRLSV